MKYSLPDPYIPNAAAPDPVSRENPWSWASLIWLAYVALGAAIAVRAMAQVPDSSSIQQSTSQSFGVEAAGTIALAAERAVRHQAGTAAGLLAQADPPDPRLRLAACAGPLSAFVTGDGALRAQTLVGVRCEAPVHWTVYVGVKIASESAVLIARRNLSRDAELLPSDFELSTRRVPGLVTNYVADATTLQGQRLRRMVAAGEALQLDAITPANLIHRGQQVTLVARGGGIEVRIAAVALADGRATDRIRVQNLSSQRVVEGIVRSDNLVEAPL